MHRIPTKREADYWFAKLAAALAVYDLPTGDGRTRTGVSADEFLLMTVREDDCGWTTARFEHRTSKNHLSLLRNSYSGTTDVVVPTFGAPFHGGTFPAPERDAA